MLRTCTHSSWDVTKTPPWCNMVVRCATNHQLLIEELKQGGREEEEGGERGKWEGVK